MNTNQKYFVDILSSHLNNTATPVMENVDWNTIYELANLHNVTGIVAIQIKKLPAPQRPEKELLSKFNQVLGYSVQNYEKKISGYTILTETLCEQKIPHLVLKGAAIRDLFPVKELRTSGDTDIVTCNLDVCTDLLTQKGFIVNQKDMVQHELSYDKQIYEIKNYIDHVMNKSESVFTKLFDYNECYTENGYTYYLKPEFHVAYIIAHLFAHIKSGGAGVRQLMDVDVLFRSYQIDLNKVFDICKEVKCLKCAKCVLSLCKQFFNTPVNFDYNIDSEIYSLLTETIFNGGVFGYGNGDKGTERLITTMRKTNNNSLLSSLKALLSVFVIDKNLLYNAYKYSAKCHLLLPVAYFHRLFKAIFIRTKLSITKIKSIFTTRDTALKIGTLINKIED